MAILFYDLETFGRTPARDRIAEFAAVRTDDDLNKREEHPQIRCVPPPDYLASPGASLKTGITPQAAAQTGVTEPQFARLLHRIFTAEPATTIIGYNSVAFDDEFVRYLMYRSLLDPYAWHSRDRNRRFDLLPLVGALYDFYRDRFSWPRDPLDRPDFRLEALTAANDAEAGTAHEALADTFGLRNLCALVRERTPSVWESALHLTDRDRVVGLLRRSCTMRARGRSDEALLVYSSPVLKRPERSTTLVVALAATDPRAPHFWLWDLSVDPAPLLALDAETVANEVFSSGREGPYAGLTLLNPRRFPVLFEPADDHLETLERHGLSASLVRGRATRLAEADVAPWLERFMAARAEREAARAVEERDVEERLYDGFPPNADRVLLHELETAGRRTYTAPDLGTRFADERLRRLAWRLRARFAPTTLTAAEREAWRSECATRLDVVRFDREWREAFTETVSRSGRPRRDRAVLAQLAEHRNAVVERFGLTVDALRMRQQAKADERTKV